MSKAQHPNYSGTVHLAADHAGYELKEFIQDKLSEIGYKVEDDGPHELDPHDDYPNMIRPAVEAVAEDKHSRAIIFGKSGQGEAMMANRIPRVRAAVYTGGDMEVVRLAREHNDANVLSIGADFVPADHAWDAVQLFLKTIFSGEDRHVRRIHELDE